MQIGSCPEKHLLAPDSFFHRAIRINIRPCTCRTVLRPRQQVQEAYFSAMSNTLQYITDAHGERTAVVLPIDDYEKLLEDLDDLAAVAERRDEPVLSHEAFLADLKSDGTL